MNQQTVELVQSSWAKVVPIAPQAAGLFYRKLFELDPVREAWASAYGLMAEVMMGAVHNNTGSLR